MVPSLQEPSAAAQLAVSVQPPHDRLVVPEGPGDSACGERLSRDAGWLKAAHQARRLSWFSLAWMSAEGILGLVAGVAASSISLIGWALGSVIEGLASAIVIWRFTGGRTLSEVAEQRAGRAVAISFFALAPYLVVESVRDLFGRHEVSTSVPGLVVPGSNRVVLPLLAMPTLSLAVRLGPRTPTEHGFLNRMWLRPPPCVRVLLASASYHS